MGETDGNFGNAGSKEHEPKHTTDEKSKNTYLGISLRGWAISAISAVAVATAVGTSFFTLLDKYRSLHTKAIETKRDFEILSVNNSKLLEELKPVEADTAAKVADAARHIRKKDRFETLLIDNDPEVTARYYPSDGCIHIIRKHSVEASPKHRKSQKDEVLYGMNDQDFWVPDPTRIADKQNTLELDPKKLDSHLGLNALADEEGLASSLRSALSTKGVLIRQPRLQRVSAGAKIKVGFIQGSCMNPHPGNFQFRNQQVNACEIQVWRTFADGCTHYQMYNACTGQWAAGVVWTYCAAQHRW